MQFVSHLWREVRRAPARILTSVFALSLAVGAIGVFAIPTVAASSLRDSAERDAIPQIVLRTTDTADVDLDTAVSSIANVEHIEPQVLTVVATPEDRELDILGTNLTNQQIDIIGVDAGRLPTAFGELIVAEDTLRLGTTWTVDAADGAPIELRVVGIGGTTFWNGEGVAFTDRATAGALEGVDGANRLVVRTSDTGKEALRSTASEIRDVLSDGGVSTKTLPLTIPNGRHPIEADIEQISSLIGLLGIVAGLVGLVLLGSTANTLITERTREVAVMRALGGTNRAMRRRLRRLAMGIALASVVVGVPLGVLISNLIARLVLEEFVGLTPGVAVSIPVMIGSALFALVGARLVAANAARRVTNRPLAAALRDRDGSPFGRRLSERLVARFATGSILDRTAVRNGVHRRARSVAMLAQITAAVAALMIIASLATTVTDYNAALDEPVRWATSTYVPGPGLDIDASLADGDPRAEVGSTIEGEVEGWEIGVYGFVPDTQMIDRTMDAGRWFEAPGEVAVSSGFAERVGLDIGDEVTVEIASGSHQYTVVGLHPDRDRTVFIDVDELADDMNLPGMGNVVMSLDDEPPAFLSGPIDVERLAEDDDDNGTAAILLIFTAIGAVVVSVAGLAVASGLAVSVYERRHEFAALQAIGGRRRHVFRVVVAELIPIAAGGIALGLVAGYLGAAAIMESFEAANAVEIGFTFASGAIPAAGAVVVAGALLIGGLMVRRVTSRPVAVVLRGAA